MLWQVQEQSPSAFDEFETHCGCLVVFAHQPHVPGSRILSDEIGATLVGKHLSQCLGDDQPHLNLVDAEFFLELRYDAVQQGGTGLAELLDEIVCGAYFIKVTVRVEVARIGDDDVGKVLADVTLQLVRRRVADLHGESVGRLIETLGA